MKPDNKKQKKRSGAQERRKKFHEFLEKAGYDTNGDLLTYRVRKSVLALSLITWIVVCVFALIDDRGFIDLMIYTFGHIFLTLFVWLFVWGCIYFFLEMRMYRRTKELEEVLPDFLQLASSNISAGMPIDRALWLAIRPSFGVLSKEIEDVAKATLSGEDLSESLKGLVRRYDSTLLKRSISILLEGLEAGGELADLLSKIALNIQELKIMRKEMAANVTTYAIFISFSSVAVAPVLFALATQLISVIMNITSQLDFSSSSSSSGISLSLSTDPALLGSFTIYCVVMLCVTASMSAIILAVIQKGTAKEGIRNIPFFIATSLIIYFFASSFLGGLLGGLI